MALQPVELKLLQGLLPLAELDQERLQELLSMCHCERLERNSNPFAVEAWRAHLLYLVKGELLLHFPDRSTTVVVGGSDEAKRPLGKWGQQSVAAKAITAIELLCLDEEMLDIMLTWDQLRQQKAAPGQAAQDFGDNGSWCPDWRLLPGMFAAQNLARGAFAALPPAHIDQLLQRFRRISVRRGDDVVRQGEPGDYYYLIESGRAQVSRMIAGTPLLLADLKPGDAFGEEALVSDATRNATVTMKTDGTLLRLNKQDFVELLRAPLLHTVSLAEAQQRVAAGAIWLDVRFAAEHKYDGIKGSRNLPLDEIRSACRTLDPQQEYIVYCQSGRRSSAAAFLLAQRGFRASLLQGGWSGGLPGKTGADNDRGVHIA